jgi:hypothetical protein
MAIPPDFIADAPDAAPASAKLALSMRSQRSQDEGRKEPAHHLMMLLPVLRTAILSAFTAYLT